MASGGRKSPKPPATRYVNMVNAKAALQRLAGLDWAAGAPKRLIYVLTPTRGLRNIGDHAQVVAIKQWMRKSYGDLPVVEIDKDMVSVGQDSLKKNIRDDDLIFLHSGGNLGDRGMWSETARRLMISNFKRNKIISLPQTIYFSGTEAGQLERQNSIDIYATHPNLTVMGRDPTSGDIARHMFPKAKVLCVPDFVLSMQSSSLDHLGRTTDDGCLLCLRDDTESIIPAAERPTLGDRLGRSTTFFDTTLPDPIAPGDRRDRLMETLKLFGSSAAVITDRYHGIIFSVLLRKPTVVLATVDHKLVSAMYWFRNIPNVVFCKNRGELVHSLRVAERARVSVYPDFNAAYFDGLAEALE